MEAPELKPCPFCGEAAELDSQRWFYDYKNRISVAVAIYCTKCSTDMSICRDDAPELSVDDACALMTEHWNRRADLVPQGWKLVSVEPTDEMICAMADAIDCPTVGNVWAAYRAMLAAAPEPRGEKT